MYTLLIFHLQVIKDVARNILSFLKSNCTLEGHTYWLFKGSRSRLFFNELRGFLKLEEVLLNVLLKLSPISRKNLGKIWPNLYNSFLQFPNILHGTNFLCY